MRSRRRTLAGALVPATALLLTLPGSGIAQDAAVTYTEGSAQLLLRGAAPTLEAFTLVSGVRDPGTLSLTLEYAGVGGDATLRIVTPSVPGTHAASAKPPRSAAVIYRGVQGRSGARAACTITWAEIGVDRVAGSYLCPKERLPRGKRTPYAALGTFTARVALPVGAPVLDPAMPIHPLGSTLEANGQSVTLVAATDLASVCVPGRAKGVAAAGCPAKRLPLEGAFSALTLEVCVTDAGDPFKVQDRTGYNQALYSGTPEQLAPLTTVATIVPGAAPAPLPKVVNQGVCKEGTLIAGTPGPLVVWLPPQGAPAMAWTLDPVALPPTAQTPGPDASGAPGSPGPDATSVTYTSGAADILVDGAVTASADDLVLTEGAYVVDASGNHVLNLVFGSASGTLTITLPTPVGSYAWDPGQATADQSVGYAIGEATLDAGLSGCQVEVVPTETGGVSGSYLCMPVEGGSATGAFVANP
jgi:hypothetical protein